MYNLDWVALFLATLETFLCAEREDRQRFQNFHCEDAQIVGLLLDSRRQCPWGKLCMIWLGIVLQWRFERLVRQLLRRRPWLGISSSLP
jgi:hypothetical protein